MLQPQHLRSSVQSCDSAVVCAVCCSGWKLIIVIVFRLVSTFAMLPDAKKQRRLQRVESGDASLMLQASSRCCPADAVKDGSLLEVLAAENFRGFQTLLGQDEALAFGPVAARKQPLRLTWASCCSGSEGAWYVMAAINKACREMGLGVRFKHVFSCESNADKRDWIREVFSHDADESDADDYYEGWCIFEDITTLCEGEAKCGFHDSLCRVKTVDLLVLGTSCKDLSKQLPDRGQANGPGKGPVFSQPQSRGGSAQTFHGFTNYVKKFRPSMIVQLGLSVVMSGGALLKLRLGPRHVSHTPEAI